MCKPHSDEMQILTVWANSSHEYSVEAVIKNELLARGFPSAEVDSLFPQHSIYVVADKPNNGALDRN